MSIQNDGQEMYQRPQYAGGGPEVQRQMDSLRELRMAQEKATHEASLGASAAMRHQDRTAGAMLGQALGGGITFQLGAPGKMFSRSDILAILRGKQAECRSPRRVGQTPDGLLVLAELVDTFENLE